MADRDGPIVRTMSAAPFAQLQVFLTVARTRSFSSAARELGVSRSAVSQSVRQLEEQLRVVLLTRTTRSVALTDAGQKLVESAGPAMGQALAALGEVGANPDETVGRVRISVLRAARPFVLDPVIAKFRARHPRIDLEISLDDRIVDIVAAGFDAGVRLSEAIERDMVAVRLTESCRFVVVGSPGYLARHGAPQRPEELLKHECIGLRSQTTGALYAWEFERGKRTWRIPVRGGLISNDGELNTSLAEQGLGLSYAFEPRVRERIRADTLQAVLEPYAASVPGLFLCYPSVAQRSTPLRLFIEAAREWSFRG